MKRFFSLSKARLLILLVASAKYLNAQAHPVAQTLPLYLSELPFVVR